METRSKTFVIESDTPWQDLGGGVQRQILGYDEHEMLVKVKFDKGSIGAPHTHPHTQSTLVVSGVFEFTVGDEKRIVRAGDGIYMEPDIMHGVVCLEAGILLDAFSPMRADFLGK